MQFGGRSMLVGACAIRRVIGVFLICAVLAAVAAPGALAKSNALWIGSGAETIYQYSPSRLKSSGTPTPITLPFDNVYSLCFDKAKNLWVIQYPNIILEFTAASLKKLPTAPSPAVTISSSSFSNSIGGCAFDKIATSGWQTFTTTA
jgi:hypothetical protein